MTTTQQSHRLRVPIGAAVAFVATALTAATHHVTTYEARVFRTVNDLTDVIHVPVVAIMQAGTLWSIALCVVYALVRRRRDAARAVGAAGAVAHVTARVLKRVVGRPRPVALLTALHRVSHDPGLGFPSGHSAVAAALATAASVYLPPIGRWVVFGVAAEVAFARVYVGAHLPFDVVGGGALGICVGALVTAVEARTDSE